MCDCDKARTSDSFVNWEDFHAFRSWLNTHNGYQQVPVATRYADVGEVEAWYRCAKCETIWRLVEPDPQFTGIWERVPGR
jgi:hypothetical protein